MRHLDLDQTFWVARNELSAGPPTGRLWRLFDSPKQIIDIAGNCRSELAKWWGQAHPEGKSSYLKYTKLQSCNLVQVEYALIGLDLLLVY